MRLAVALFLFPALLAAAPRDDHPWGSRCKAGGKHYVVETNTFPEVARDLAVRLDRAFALYEDRFGPLTGRARRPMRIHLYRTKEEYLARGEGVAGALGHFDPSLDACSLVWTGEVGETGWPIAVHEACHHYLYRRYGRIRLPSWYAEGIACFFEGVQDETSPKNVSRMRQGAARAALRDGQAKLDVLLDTAALVQRGRLAVSGMSPSRYYGLAWSFVHFLATDARYKLPFRRFEMRLFAARRERGFDWKAALAEECGPLGELEAEWKEHLAALEPAPAIVRTTPHAWELASESAFVRYAALKRIVSFPFPDDLEAGVFACLRDGDVAVRTEATRLMRQDPREEGVYALLASLDRGDPGLRKEAMRALGHRVMDRAVPRLLEETEDRAGALRALAGIGDARAFPALRKAALDRGLDAETRARCIRTLGRDPAAAAVLERILKSEESALAGPARRALVRLGALEDPSASLLAASEQPLDRRGTRDLVRMALDPSEDTDLRLRACEQLGNIRARVAVPALRRLCRAGVDAAVRLEALRALVRITGEARGYEPGQPASEREAAFRAWADR